MNSYPHPEADFNAFVNVIQTANGRTGTVWSPKEKANREWVNVKKLKSGGGGGGCVIC